MKREIGISIIAVALATGLSILGLRIFVPRLFNVSSDMQFVQTSEKLPPFYEGVFAQLQTSALELLIKDPITSVRGTPFYPEIAGLGPHDVLGFRNRSVPHSADVITIGDSMTYGNNVILAETWPQVLKKRLSNQEVRVYSMATGGWAAIQYLDLFEKSLNFKPKVVIVGFYSGNDALESFRDAYRLGQYNFLRVDPQLQFKDMPAVPFPPPADQSWPVKFDDNSSTTFTPSHRLLSNDVDSKVVKAGYKIIEEVANRIHQRTQPLGISLVLMLIPTKELVFLPRLENEKVPLRQDYLKLVNDESKYRAATYQAFSKLNNVITIDPLPALQKQALSNTLIYPPDANGHPLADGYSTIADTIAPKIDSLLSKRKPGVYRSESPDKRSWFYLYREGRLLLFATPQIAAENGWRESDFENLPYREIEAYDLDGVIRSNDRLLFGPPITTQEK